MDLTSNDGVEQKPKAIYLKDYRKPDYLVDELALEFNLNATKTIVENVRALLSLYYPDFGPLNLWKAPEYLVWGVIGCGLSLFLPNTAIKVIGLNGLLILMTVYFFQGIAIVSFYFDKKRLPRFVRVFLYTLIALQQLILLAVIGLGFFDLWVNFRRSGKQPG